MNESIVARRPCMSGATSGSSTVASQSARSVICMAAASAMLMPLIFEDRAPSFSRVPWQSGHAVNFTARSTNARMWGCRLSRSFCNIDFVSFGMRPSYVMLMFWILTFVGSL